jgi:hypothetical protein
MNRYKLVIFLNAFHMTDEQREWIDNMVKGGGRTVVWCYAPGLFNGPNQSVAAMQDVTGLRIVPSTNEEFVKPQIAFIADTHQLAAQLVQRGVTVAGPNQASGKLFYVEPDPSTKTLGVLPGSRYVTAAIKDMTDWTSVYVMTPALPAVVYREFARMAGVHIFNDQDDAFYVNASYLTLSSDGAGERTIRLPVACDVFDLRSGQTLQTNTRSIHRRFDDKETVLLRYVRR